MNFLFCIYGAVKTLYGLPPLDSAGFPQALLISSMFNHSLAFLSGKEQRRPGCRTSRRTREPSTRLYWKFLAWRSGQMVSIFETTELINKMALRQQLEAKKVCLKT